MGDGVLEPETIEEWLEVEPGGAVSCRLRPQAQSWQVAQPALLFLLVALIYRWFGANVFYHPAVWWSFLPWLWFAVSSHRLIRADAQGLSIRRFGRTQYYAWSEITNLSKEHRGWRVITTRGGIKLLDAFQYHVREM